MSLKTITPYRGLRPFTQAEALYFFGRKMDVRLVLAHLLTSKLTVLYGKSGVGKSSLLMAGVIPSLEQTKNTIFFVVRDWSDKSFFENLKSEICITIWGDDKKKEGALLDILQEAVKATGKTLTFIFDQFEDYFEYQKEKTDFESEFAIVVNTFELSANFLLSMRDDHLSQLDRFKMRIPGILDNTYQLKHLSEESAKDAIRKPLKAYHEQPGEKSGPVDIETALVDELIKQCATDSAVPAAEQENKEVLVEAAVLELVLDQLWNTEQVNESPEMRLSTLNKLGGVKHILENHLNHKLEMLSSSEKRLCAKLFDRIVTPSGRKLTYSKTDLLSTLEVSKEALTSLLKLLTEGQSRILRTLPPASGENENNPRYELFHDKLAVAAQNWLEEYNQCLANIKTRKRYAIAIALIISAIGSLQLAKYFYDTWSNSPFAYLADLSNDKQYPVTHELTLISRYVDEKLPDNYVPIKATQIISRIHFLINRNIETKVSEAQDVRSSYGSMINGDFLQYGQIHKLENADIISLAGNQNFKYIPVKKSFFPKAPPRTAPVPSANQWGIFIDSANKQVTPLSSPEYFVAYDTKKGYVLSEDKKPDALAIIHTDFDVKPGSGDVVNIINLSDLSDNNDLILKYKVDRYDAYRYAEKVVPPGNKEVVVYNGVGQNAQGNIEPFNEAVPIVFRYGEHFFQIAAVSIEK